MDSILNAAYGMATQLRILKDVVESSEHAAKRI